MLVRPRSRRVVVLGVVVVMLLASWRSWGRPLRLFEPRKPKPDVANIRYGPHDRNVFDLWKAKPNRASDAAHAGGDLLSRRRVSNRRQVECAGRLIERCLAAGISVASANYRLSETAAFPAPMLDGARAIQFVRKNAEELGIDPDADRRRRQLGRRGHRTLGRLS